jgi:hypothetical protein
MTWMDISGEEPLLVVEFLRGSSDFTFIFNIFMGLMQKAL